MKPKAIIDAAARGCNKIGFGFKKKSPEILIAVGIVGFFGAIGTACVATTKAGKIIDDTKDMLDDIHTASEKGITKAGELYDDQDQKRDLTIAYAQTALKFVKLYGPTVILAVGSATCVLSSHRILKRRNLALAAAYAAIDKSFAEYRGRVIDRFGEQVEKELRYNVKAGEIQETIVDEDGKEKKIKKTVDKTDPNFDVHEISPYAVIIDSSHKDWSRDTHMMGYYFKARQSQLTNTLRAKGHLFLNEVYDTLGVPRTSIGAVAGWIFDQREPYGDDYVDFRLQTVYRAVPGEDGDPASYEPVYIFDFNVKGNILDKIEDHQYI